MDPFHNRYVLITGGSKGIGFELAKLFAKEGAKLILVARDAGRLAEASSLLEKEFGSRPLLISKDLARPEAPKEIFDELSAKEIFLDVLVNNAGFGVSGKFHTVSLERALQVVDVNVRAVVHLTRLFLPSMVQKDFGKILNIASTAGFQAIPTESVYAAAKGFVILFSEALADELAGTGVGVTCLAPGPTDTSFFGEGGVTPSRLIKKSMMASKTVAECGMKALRENKVLVVPGRANRATRFLERFLPRKLVTKLARRVVE